MPADNEDFAETIAKAQTVNKDMSGIFGNGAAGRVAFEPAPDRAGPDMEWDAHCDVFCLPSEKEGYEDVMNKCLHGEAVKQFEDRTFTKDGDFMIAFCYLTPREQVRAPDDEDAGDAEPEVRPRKLP